MILGDYLKAISNISSKKEKMDIIFIDPPYYKGLFGEVLKEIVDQGILEEDGILVVEHDYQVAIEEVDGLNIIKNKKYGKTAVTIYGLEDEDE